MGKENILITGATGFIGSHVAKRLLEESYNVIAIVRKGNNYKNVEELKLRGAVLVEGKFYDTSLAEKVFRDFSIGGVVHIAALRGGGLGTKQDYCEVNVLGTETLLEASLQHKIKRFIFLSSVGVLGTIPRDLPGNPLSEFNGDNCYHKSKVLAELKVNEYVSKGVDAYIIRPTITYGVGDNGFPSTLVNLVKRRMLLLSSRDIKIHLLDVTSLSDLIVKIMKINSLEQRVFIAADDAPISLKELIDQIYSRFYHTEYPAFLQLPDAVYRALLFGLRVIRNEKWLTRLLLISSSWHYDSSLTNSMLNFTPARTNESFVKKCV
jgi:2-alkyl-3-oxoalkanoate reductase